jgi:hypothetical protein
MSCPILHILSFSLSFSEAFLSLLRDSRLWLGIALAVPIHFVGNHSDCHTFGMQIELHLIRVPDPIASDCRFFPQGLNGLRVNDSPSKSLCGMSLHRGNKGWFALHPLCERLSLSFRQVSFTRGYHSDLFREARRLC